MVHLPCAFACWGTHTPPPSPFERPFWGGYAPYGTTAKGSLFLVFPTTFRPLGMECISRTWQFKCKQAILHTHSPKNALLMCDSVPNLPTGNQSVMVPRWCPTLQNHAVTDYAALFARFEKRPIPCGFAAYTYEAVCDHVTVKIVSQIIKIAISKRRKPMKFTNSELEMIYQYAATTKEETLARLKEAVSALKDTKTRVIVEKTIDKLSKISEPECSQFIEETKTHFLKNEAETQAKEPLIQGHDLNNSERFNSNTSHLITFDVLSDDSMVGYKGERYRYFLTDKGYQNAKKCEQWGEIRILDHATVIAGKLHPDNAQQEFESHIKQS